MSFKFDKKLKFIDLFSGIGGFHQALKSFNIECILAAEIDPYAIATYDNNYKIANVSRTSGQDITKINVKEIMDFDILTAGFPCQTFSKAGKQLGFRDKVRGTFFFDIARILNEKKPKYLMLENVRNLASHDSGNTWNTIKDTLVKIGYVIPKQPIIMSPHQLGIPQLRERVFIPGYFCPKKAGKKWIEINVPKLNKNSLQAKKIIDKNAKFDNSLKIDEYEIKVLNAWDDFYKNIDLKIIGFPVWANELNSRKIDKSLPKWKINIIKKNKDLYLRNSNYIEKWKKQTRILSTSFVPTHRKFEWQAGNSIKSIYEGIIQFRPSGIRVKRPTVFPTLVAMVHTPIVGWEKRYLSVGEVAKLQSFPKSFKYDKKVQQAYKQFGNSVNVKVVKYIFEELLKQINKMNDI